MKSLAALLLATIAAAATVQGAEPRHALVIGNSSYTYGALRNPVNDARAIARELTAAGFTVSLLENATQSSMQRAIRNLGDHLAKGGVGLFYYAGHGIQSKGRNYLVPVNADIGREYEIEYNAVNVNMVLSMMDAAKNPLNIVILDACRNNPFAPSFRVSTTGLAQMDAPAGTFIAFATAPGSIGSDGTGDNGIYTKHLLEHMRTPGLTLEHLFKQVRVGVMAETKGEQVPWESSSLRGDFAFRPGPTRAAAADQKFALALTESMQSKREAQRREAEALIQEALGRRRGAPGQEDRPGLMKPLLVLPAPLEPRVSVSPGAAASRLPREGDTWIYKLLRNNFPATYAATVTAATESAILERYGFNGGDTKEWVHQPGNYLVVLGVTHFSPYLTAFGTIAPGSPPSDIDARGMVCPVTVSCRAEGKSVRRETVQVPAGTFGAIKVTVEYKWVATTPSTTPGGRDVTVWYVPEVKRVVKVSSRNAGTLLSNQNWDLELVSYQLR